MPTIPERSANIERDIVMMSLDSMLDNEFVTNVVCHRKEVSPGQYRYTLVPLPDRATDFPHPVDG